MALKLIGAGFGRTGTESTHLALGQLGFPCYHMREVLANPANKTHLDFWCEVARAPPGAPHDWSRVFANYTATVDNPGCCVWRELLAAYPDAKVLLTLHPRGAEAWFDSTLDTIYYTESMWEWRVMSLVLPFARKLGAMTHELVWKRSLGDTMPDRARAIARYNAYSEAVQAAVPAERLLVYQVTEGWAPLCAFLGVPVPATPFPNVNDRAAFRRGQRRIVAGAWVIVGLAAAVAALLIGALVRLLS